jgi:RNA polymerase sigma factor (sigma-70 family)
VSVPAFALRDVRDVPALARRALESRMSEWGATLNPDDKEDALAFLIATAWELERSFREDVGIAYSTYCFRMLRLRLVDWYRDRFRDARYGGRDCPRCDAGELDGAECHECHGTGKVGPAIPELVGEEALEQITAEWNTITDVVTDVFVEINVASLSPDSRRALDRIAKPMVEEGLTMDEIAERLGFDRRWVSKALKRLRDELEQARGADA